MAATLTANIAASISATYQNTTNGVTATAPFAFNFSAALTSGTGASGTADLIYGATLTITGGGNTTIDLVGGSTDILGTAISMARLKFLYINLATTTTASSITVGNATNPINLFSAATTTVSIRNDGIFLMGTKDATGIAMTGGASDGLKIVNADGSNSATVNVCAIGSSA